MQKASASIYLNATFRETVNGVTIVRCSNTAPVARPDLAALACFGDRRFDNTGQHDIWQPCLVVSEIKRPGKIRNRAERLAKLEQTSQRQVGPVLAYTFSKATVIRREVKEIFENITSTVYGFHPHSGMRLVEPVAKGEDEKGGFS